MKNKIWPSFDEAVADIPDGASIAMYFWGFPGCPQNLIRALKKKGVKGITLIVENFIPTPFSEEDFANPVILFPQVRKLITPYASTVAFGGAGFLTEALQKGELEIEPVSHGVLMERLRAAAGGIGGFYSPVGIGTVLEEGKEKRMIDGKDYILEKPLKPDFGFVRAYKADRYGNLIYQGVGRGNNPIVAMASKVTIAEVDEIVESGEIDPEVVVTPGVFVDRIIKIPEGGPGSYRHTMGKIQEILSIEWIRGAILGTKKEGGQQ